MEQVDNDNILELDLAFNIAGSNYKFITIQERTADKNYDIMIFVHSALRYRDFGTNVIGPDIKHQKYSVHLSPNSVTGINAIKHILDLSNGKSFETLNYTKALKKNNVFAVLFIARSPSLLKEYRLCNKGTRVLTLDSYNPEQCTLYYSIVIANADKEIDEKMMKGVKHRIIKTHNFAILVIWQYCFGPSDDTGTRAHFLTVPNEQIPHHVVNESDIGYNIEEVIKLFKSVCSNLFEEFIHIRKNILSEIPDAENLIRKLGFYMECKLPKK